MQFLDKDRGKDDKIIQYCSKALYSNNRLSGIQFFYHKKHIFITEMRESI